MQKKIMIITLPINEIFETIQGEAHWTGTPSIFMRFQGCPVGCGWCDTKHTWKIETKFKTDENSMLIKNIDSEHYAEMTTSVLMKIIKKFKAQHVVITGGEPCIHDLTELTTAIIESNRSCQIETSGTFLVKAHVKTWITVSPKINMTGGMKVLNKVISMASEIKHPVGKIEDINNLNKKIIPWKAPNAEVWLQPLSQSRKATNLCIEQAKIHNYKISIQTHKFIGVR
jgi:7-carboxy-7-deazaguanine synthase